ncbi:MAG: FAD-binding protein [Acidimicrobiia bacterium]|nr:FAD-binding protein [Acidimicrobiia bacterium]
MSAPRGEPVAEALSPTIHRPETIEDLAELLRKQSDSREAVAIVGSGSHRWMGSPPNFESVIEMGGFAGVRVFEPDDLTVVVGAGTAIGDLEGELAEGGKTAVLPESDPIATIGGVISSGASGYRRARFGPTRDRVLEVTAVTGDGRAIRSGGRVVKNVTGYDLPRLYTGSFGSLGVIESVCLKLWPLPERTVTVTVEDPERAVELVHRPLAMLDVSGEYRVMLAGTAPAVEGEAKNLGGVIVEGFDWPQRPDSGVRTEVRVPPARIDDVVSNLHSDYIAQIGVGVVETTVEEVSAVNDLRSEVESWGGVVLVEGGRGIDPWGTPPPTLNLQRRVIAEFDPHRILEPGRLPGGI